MSDPVVVGLPSVEEVRMRIEGCFDGPYRERHASAVEAANSVRALFAAAVPRIRAEALREAAERMYADTNLTGAYWLEDEADRIEAGQ